MSMSVNNVLSNYTYTYQSERRPILDQNYDSIWSKDEVAKYAEDYKAATGTELDVDAIFKQYDTDSSGSLEFAEYEVAGDNDAFGIALLSQKQSEASSQLGSSAGSDSSSSVNGQESAIKSTATLKDVLANYTYSVKGELNVILDKNYDSVWSADEIAQYAADYKSATGTELDLDAIYKQYDTNNDGSLEFTEYEAAAVDDAFGTTLLSQKKSEAADNAATGSTGNTPESSESASVNAQASAIKSTATLKDVLSNYTYTYQGDTQLILDKNYDSVWSADEIAQYAADYKSATGTQLDADAIFKQYDTNGNDALEYAEYESARANDAFGISLLSQKKAEANSSLGFSQGSSLDALNGTQSSENSDAVEEIPMSLTDWLQSLGNTTRTSLVNTTVWADNTSNLLNRMLSVNNSYSNIGYGLMQYTNINSYANAAYQASTLFMSV